MAVDCSGHEVFPHVLHPSRWGNLKSPGAPPRFLSFDSTREHKVIRRDPTKWASAATASSGAGAASAVGADEQREGSNDNPVTLAHRFSASAYCKRKHLAHEQVYPPSKSEVQRILAAEEARVEKRLQSGPTEIKCRMCNAPDRDDKMLLCSNDKCPNEGEWGWHMTCLPVVEVDTPPEDEDWFCPTCQCQVPTTVTVKVENDRHCRGY